MEKKRSSITANQAKVISRMISTLVSCVIVICAIVIMLKVVLRYCLLLDYSIIIAYVIFVILILLLISDFIHMLVYQVILKGPKREKYESKEKVEKLLSREELSEVFYDFSKLKSSDNIGKVVKIILQQEGIEFYASLDEQDVIILIAKDKHNEEVYKTKITDYNYFLENFS